MIGPHGSELLAADAVIVTLGTYATPAALLRSGIGPAAELALPRHRRRWRRSTAWGGGMQDHPKVSYRFPTSPCPPRPGRAPGTSAC